MNEHESQAVSSLEIVIETDALARKQAIMLLERSASAN